MIIINIIILVHIYLCGDKLIYLRAHTMVVTHWYSGKPAGGAGVYKKYRRNSSLKY